MFRAANVVILNETDLQPYLNLDVEACMEDAKTVNPGI